MNRKLILTAGLSLALILLVAQSVLTLVTGSTLTAQSDPVPLPTAPQTQPQDRLLSPPSQSEPSSPEQAPTLGNEAEATPQLPIEVQQELADRDARRTEMRIEDYDIVYIASSPNESVLQILSETVGPVYITEWDALLAFNNEAGIDALIVDESGVHMLDTAWTGAAYRRGIPVVGVNLTWEQLGQITGDRCTTTDFNTAWPREGDFHIFAHLTVHAVVSDEHDFITQFETQECSEKRKDEIQTGGYAMTKTELTWPLREANDGEYVAILLLDSFLNNEFTAKHMQE